MAIPARFQYIRELGHGGMGVVYEVYDRERGMRVALKTVHRLEPDDIVRFKREFRALSRFNHPNVIHLYELVAEGDELCFSMEVIDGRHILSYVCRDPELRRGAVTQSVTSNWDVTAAELMLDEMPGERLESVTDFVFADAPAQSQGQTATTIHVPTLVLAELREAGALPQVSEGNQAGELTELTAISEVNQVGELTELTAISEVDQVGELTELTAISEVDQAGETGETVDAVPGSGEVPAPSERVALADRVELERMGAILGQLADALRALHAAGLVHCDLTPSNVMVTHEGRVVVMDFGVVSALRRSADLGALPSLAGTPSFIAPEQLRGAPPTAATDWYSFGVILYRLLTGQLPFTGPSPFKVMRAQQEKDPAPPGRFTTGIPAELEALCLRLLARDPAQRPMGDEVLSVLARTLPMPGAPESGPGGVAGQAGADVFVGRKDELAVLHQSLGRVREHGLQCVLIAGLSGMGKSTLASRFADEIGQADQGRDPAAPAPLVQLARCHDRETLAYKALDSIIDGLYLYLDEVSVAQRPELAPRHVGLLSRLFPVLARLPEHEHEEQPELAASVELRTQAVVALRELLGAVALRRPLVLLIEDLQWADADSFELLGGLLRPPAVAGLLLILTVRTDALASPTPALARFLDLLSQHPEQRRITLGPLTPAEQEELARRLDSGQGGRLQVDDTVWQASAGHPLLLAELVRYARSAPADRPAVGVPPLEELLWRRVTGVGESGRVLLETLAVMGEPAPVPVLARAAALPPADRERALVAVTAAQLARIVRTDRDTWLDVYHDKVRESVLGRLAPEHLRRIHGRVAGAMEDWAEAPPAALAHHWMAAGSRDKAIDYLMKTASSSESKLAFERASHLYREVATMLEGAPQTPALDAWRVQAWLGLARALRLSDRYDEAMVLLDRAQPLATQLDRNEELAEIHYVRGNLIFLRGDYDGCMAEHQRALIHATRASSPRLQACALSGLGDAHYLRGRMGAAQKYYDRCIELCTKHRFFDTESANLTVRGLMRFYHNDFAGALHDGEQAVLLASRIGHERAEVSAVLNALARVWIERGELDRARPQIERVHAMAERGGLRRFEATAKVFLGRMLADQGKLDEGEALIDAGVNLMRATNITFILPLALGTLARVARNQARREATLTEGRRLLAAGSASINHLYFHRDAMDVYLAQGELDRVLEHSDALAAYTREEPLPWSEFFLARGRTLVAYARNPGHPGTRAMLGHLSRHAHSIGFLVAARVIDDVLGDGREDVPA